MCCMYHPACDPDATAKSAFDTVLSAMYVADQTHTPCNMYAADQTY